MDGRERGPAEPGDDQAAQVADLRRLVEVHRDLARAAAAAERATRAELRATEAELRKVRADLKEVDRRFTAFRARRFVRVAVAIADRVGRLRRRGAKRPPPAPGTEPGSGPATAAGATTAGAAGTEPEPGAEPGTTPATPPAAAAARPTEAEEAATRARLLAAGEAPARTEGPLVSIVMPTRDGAGHLRRTLPSLARSAYANLELIVVDNASGDDTAAVLAAFAPGFPVTVIRNEQNESYAAANNAAARAAGGGLLLFLNNDVQPVGAHWLGHLVETLDAPDVTAAGARLVYPSGEAGPRAGRRFADLTLQHAGVWFRPGDGAPLASPIGVGEAPDGADAVAVRDVPALTAACLLVRRAAFEAVGGFDEGYEYGQEDVDLCLRLRAAGWRLVYDGRAVLWHHESATRVLDDAATRRRRTAANRERFLGTWSRRLFRTTLADAIDAKGFWRPPLHVGLVPSPSDRAAADRAAALRATGWAVSELRGDGAAGGEDPPLDALLVADPAHDVRTDPGGLIRVGIVDPGEIEAWLAAPWLPDLDVVVAASATSAERIAAATGIAVTIAQDPLAPGVVHDALAGWVGARRIAIRSPVPSWEVAPTWGDHHFARDLQRALRRLGRPTRLQLLPDWSQPWAARDDVAINLVGVAVPPSAPGQLSVLWQISHPDLASPGLYERHDLVFVASDPFARWMGDRVTVPVAPLHQATDPARFAPGRAGRAHELLFVANSRGVRRHLLDDLLPTDRELAVYGHGWTPERLDPAHRAGELIPNDVLAGFYAAAGIVLNDHWADMQREGFLSNRLYDAAAAGAFVISDAIDGLREEFDGGIVGYHGRDELRALVDAYLADPDARAARAARARAAVLARHTFDHRAREILAAIAPLEAARAGAVVPPLDGRPSAGAS